MRRSALGRHVAIAVVLAGALSAGVALVSGASAAESSQQLWKACATGSTAGQCLIPRGVAADPSLPGHVFVADQANRRIDEFTAWGNFVKAWGWGVRDGASELQTCDAESGCQTGKTGGGAGQLTAPQGIAVDSEGAVYVADFTNRRVQKFDSAGDFLWMVGGEVNKTTLANLCTKADLEGGDECGSGTTGAADGQFGAWPVGSFVAIGPGDVLYVGDVERIQEFESDGSFKQNVALEKGPSVEAVRVRSLAVAPAGATNEGNIYLSREIKEEGKPAFAATEGVLELKPNGAKQCEAKAINPAAVASDAEGNLYVDDVRTGAETTRPSRVLEYEPGCEASGEFEVPELDSSGFGGQSTGIGAGSACLSEGADVYLTKSSGSDSFLSAYGPPPDLIEEPECLPPEVPPTIGAQFATSVDPDGAVVKAKINPHFWTDATYQVQYGTKACIDAEGFEGPCAGSQPATPAALQGEGAQPAGAEVTSGGVFLPELASETEYSYRFLSESSGGGPSFGSEATFTTPAEPGEPSAPCPNEAFRSGPSAQLTDCRAYEMVSPIDKGGAGIQVNPSADSAFPTRLDLSAASGDQLTYSANAAFGDAVTGVYANQYLATRHAGEEWRSEGISPAREGIGFSSGFNKDNEFAAFAGDLSHGWLSRYYDPPLSPGAPPGFSNVYRRDSASGAYRGLIEATPRNASLRQAEEGFFVPELQGVSSDGEVTAIDVAERLTPEASLIAPGPKLNCVSRKDAKPETAAYQWLADGAPIGGATTATYTTTAGDAGKAIQCRATAKNGEIGVVQFANPAWQVAPAPGVPAPVAPLEIAAPGSDEALTVGGPGGQALSCDPGEWEGSPTFSYQWYRNGEAISGATEQGYETTPADVATAAVFQCALSATNAGGTVAEASEPLATDPAPSSPAAPEADARMASPRQLYVSGPGGQLALASALPDGTACPAAASAGTLNTDFSSGRYQSVAGALSADGSRIYFSCGGVLYLRESPLAAQSASGECDEAGKACTRKVSGLVTEGGAQFWAASGNGSKAIFSADVKVGLASEPRLYEYDAGTGEASLIAKKPVGVMGASADASEAYFASEEALAGVNVDEVNSAGDEAVGGADNLYLYRAPAGGGEASFAFIGTIAEPPGFSPIIADPTVHTARVSPDGQSAAFSSKAPLTHYDNADAESGEADLEVFLYRAGSDELACASCNPNGARPQGRDGDPEQLVFGQVFPGWIAAWVPAWAKQLNQPRYLSEDGSRLFFNSYERLVPRDTNSVQDVYEWEAAAGKAACEQLGADRYVPSSGGCLSLISSGTGGVDAEFLDASPDGRDVFFTTAASLVPQDPGLVDIYDAREGGGLPSPAGPQPACEGEACQSPPPAPEQPTPSSAQARKGNLSEASNPFAACNRAARRAKRLATGARRLARRSKSAKSPRAARRLARNARRLSRRARGARAGAKRCRARARKRTGAERRVER